MKSDHLQKNGTVPKKEKSGIPFTEKKIGMIEKNLPQYVNDAGQNIKLSFRADQNIALTIANKEDVTKDKKLSLKYVHTAVKNFWRIVTGILNVVPIHVATESVQETSVYNLTLDRDNVYYANGILVDNCLALSFAVPVTSKNRISAQGLHFAQANGGPLNFNGQKQFAAHNYKLFR